MKLLYKTVELDVAYGVYFKVGRRWSVLLVAEWGCGRYWWPRPETPLLRVWAFGPIELRRLVKV